MDLSYLVNQIKANPQGLRLRQGKVITVNSDYTMDVQIAGDTNTLPSVRYLSNYAPKPDDQVWLLNTGADLLGFGMVAGAGRTLAPVAYRTTLYTVAQNTDTTIPFQAVSNDDWDMWDVGSPSVLTCKVPGRYLISASTVSESQSNTSVSLSLFKGTQEIARIDEDVKTASHAHHMNLASMPITLAVNDTVSMKFLHDHNPDLDLVINAGGVDHTGYFNALSLVYLGS